MTTATTYPATAYPRRKPVVTALQKPETTSGITYAIEFNDVCFLSTVDPAANARPTPTPHSLAQNPAGPDRASRRTIRRAALPSRKKGRTEAEQAKYQQDANIHRGPAHNRLRIPHHIKTHHPHHINQRHPPKPAIPLPLSPLSYPRPQPNPTTASTSNPAPPLQPRKKIPFLQERRTLEPARERPEDAGKESGRLRRKIPPGPLREDNEDEKVLMGRLGDASGDGVRWAGVRGAMVVGDDGERGGGLVVGDWTGRWVAGMGWLKAAGRRGGVEGWEGRCARGAGECEEGGSFLGSGTEGGWVRGLMGCGTARGYRTVEEVLDWIASCSGRTGKRRDENLK